MKNYTEATCAICNKLCRSLGQHISKLHKLKAKDYYDLYLKGDTNNICPVCGKETPFISITIGYQKHCSANCGVKNPETLENYKKSMLDKYGVEYTNQSPELYQKTKNTKLAKYGDSNYNNRDKAHTTVKNKYGVDNIMQLSSVKDKMRQTCLNKYGVEYATQSTIVKEKTKQTCLDKYNVDNPAKSSVVKSKICQTNLDKYGVSCTLQSPEVIKKRKQTLLDRYGVDHNFKSPELQEHIKQSNISKYGVPYYVQSLDFKTKYQYTLEHKSYINSKISSTLEQDIYNSIKFIYDDVITINNRGIIYPQEIDLYLPKLKLAIEVNGLFWHSIQGGKPIDYHLNKSLLCREKGIRLIHIYEFEDFDTQIELLKSFILGEDRYPKNDFNKNNLIDDIPKPEIIYNQNGYVIYGAGRLY